MHQTYVLTLDAQNWHWTWSRIIADKQQCLLRNHVLKTTNTICILRVKSLSFFTLGTLILDFNPVCISSTKNFVAKKTLARDRLVQTWRIINYPASFVNNG